ncbi:hypothetical protein ACET3Z_022598 [Daucus carota]
MSFDSLTPLLPVPFALHKIWGPDMEQFELYFRRADMDQDGRITGPEAVAFFQATDLPRQVLAQEYTSKSEFGIVLLALHIRVVSSIIPRKRHLLQGSVHRCQSTYFGSSALIVLNKRSSITEVYYKDDKTIMAWELMNEPRCPTPVWKRYKGNFLKKYLFQPEIEGSTTNPAVRKYAASGLSVEAVPHAVANSGDDSAKSPYSCTAMIQTRFEL